MRKLTALSPACWLRLVGGRSSERGARQACSPCGSSTSADGVAWPRVTSAESREATWGLARAPEVPHPFSLRGPEPNGVHWALSQACTITSSASLVGAACTAAADFIAGSLSFLLILDCFAAAGFFAVFGGCEGAASGVSSSLCTTRLRGRAPYSGLHLST